MFGRTSIGVVAVAVLTVAAATVASPSTSGAAGGISADAVVTRQSQIDPRVANCDVADGEKAA